VHLVNRRERHGLEFPSLMFIRQTRQRVRQSRTLRDRGLLLLRCMALILLVTAFAGPIVGGPTAATEGPDKATVLLLDRSYSMSHGDRWNAALEIAADRIAAMSANEHLAMFAFDDEVTTVQGFTGDKAILSAALAGLTARDRSTRFHLAFSAAARMLADSAADKRSVALVSDLQRVGFGSMDNLMLAADLDLEIYAVESPLGANGVVMGVAEAGPVAAKNAALRLSVLVANTGDEALMNAVLRLEVEDREQFRQRIDLQPGGERRVEIPVTPAADRYLPVRVTITADDLQADDSFLLVLPPLQPISVLLVENTPIAPSSGDFARQALEASGTFDLRVPASTALALDDLRAAQVVVLNDLALGADFSNRLLGQYLRNGGVVLALTGEHFDQSPALGVSNATTVYRADQPAFVDRLRERHPLWSRLGLNTRSGLEQVVVNRYRSLAPQPTDRVLAWYDDGEAFLIERPHEDGLALIMTTSLERRWSDLALHPHFVPLLRELVRYLASAVTPRISHTVGDLVPVMLSANTATETSTAEVAQDVETGIVVEHPSGAQTVLPIDAPLVRVTEPGFYQVHGAPSARAPALIAVNSDRSESALAVLGETAFRDRLVRSSSRAGEATRRPLSEQDERSNLWWYLLLLAGLALVLECVISNRRARPSGQTEDATGVAG
jgi:hypothetical protein